MYRPREEQNTVDPEVERIRAQARQVAENDPDLRRERQELATARAAAQKEFDDLQWQTFFNRNRHVKDCFSNRQPLETYARSLDPNGALKAQNLQEALQHPDIARQLDVDKHYVPATTANLTQDKTTLENFCRTSRLQYPGESALRILRDTYGGQLGGWAIQDAIDRKLITANPENDPETLAQLKRAEEVARARYLREQASPSELRQAVRAEGQQWAQKSENEQKEASQKLTSQMQTGYAGYPPLPERWTDGSFINKAWLMKISNVNYPLFKQLCHRHGTAQVTERINQG
jgi:hypothetical protein